MNINFFHSGGSANCNPLLDLGGAISICGVTSLFDNLTPVESREGLIDYRCIYAKNTSGNILRNAYLYINSQQIGSFVDVGVQYKTCVQQITLSGSQPPNEGDYMTVSLSGYVSGLVVNYSPFLSVWQAQLQNELNAVDGLNGLVVSATGTIGYPTNVVFTITFSGEGDGHALAGLSVGTSNLSNQTANTIIITGGLPTNSTASTTLNIFMSPNISFFCPYIGSPIVLGSLLPGDIVPIWLRRSVAAGTRAYLESTFSLNVGGATP